MFVGRKNELSILENDLKSQKSEFCIIYGRRRIGKSTLLKKFMESKKFFYFQPVLIASAGVSKNVASYNKIIVLTLGDLF